MKKFIVAIFLLCFSSAFSQAQTENYFFRVVINALTVEHDDTLDYLNYIYTGAYLSKNDIKKFSLEKYTPEDEYKQNNICLIFSDMIYKISFNKTYKEDDWNIITKANITMIHFPGTNSERTERLILASGKIKFDPQVGLILFIKTTVKEDESKKI